MGLAWRRGSHGDVSSCEQFFVLSHCSPENKGTGKTEEHLRFSKNHWGTLQGTPLSKCGATMLPFLGGGVPIE